MHAEPPHSASLRAAHQSPASLHCHKAKWSSSFVASVHVCPSPSRGDVCFTCHRPGSVMLAGPPFLPPSQEREWPSVHRWEPGLKQKHRENKAKAAPCEWPFCCSPLFGQWQKYTELTFNSWVEGFSMTLEALITKRDKRPPACCLILPHPAVCFIPEVAPWPSCPRGCDPCPVQ